MALVAFLRGVNVGKHRRFLPAALARELSHLEAVNIGAVGTYVARKARNASALREEIVRRLPFEAEVFVCTAREILDLAESKPFSNPPSGSDVREMVTVLSKKPKSVPKLPIRRPEGKDWQVDFFSVQGRFALSFWRPGARVMYPTPEKDLALSGTTRSWGTFEKIVKAIRGAAS
jgi:uncharacterized protein (DUF1697 family)